MTSASMHPTYPSQTLDSTSSHQPQSPSATRLPAQPPFLHPHRNQVLDSTQHHEQQHQQQEQASWYSSRAQDQGFDHSDPPAAPEHSSPDQNATFTSDHHHNAQSTESYRPNYQAYNPQADRFSAFHSPPQPAAPPHHDPRQLPTSPHSDGSKHQGSLSRTSNLTIGTLRASYTSPHAQTRSDASVNDQHQGGPGRRQALTSDAHASSFDDTYKDSYEAPHAKREVKDDYGYGLPPLQHSYYSTPRSHREPNALFRTSESSPSASGSYSHASPSTSILPPPSHPSHSHHLHSSSSRFIPDDGPGGQSRYGHPNLSEAAPVAEFAAAAATAPPAAASSSPSPPSSSSAHRQHHHLPPLSESFGSSFPRPTNSTMNFRPDGLGGPMPLAPSPLDHNGYPTAINTQVPGHGSAYALDHPFPNDYPGQGSPGLGSPGGLASNQASPLRSPAKRGKKVEMACHFCRGRKLKCDGVQPRCQHCTKRGQHCTWDSHVRRRGPGLKNKSKEPKGGVSKRRESVSTSTGRSTVSPKTPSRHSLDDPLEGHHRGPSEIMTPDGELPYPAYPIKGEEMEGDVPLTTGTNSPFAHPPYPAPSSAFAQVPAQDPYATAQYPGQQHPHYGPPSPSVPRVIMSRTPSSSLAGAMGPDPNYSAYHASDSDQGSAVHHQDSTWRRHSIAGGQCADPSAYISETTGGGAVYWDRDNASDGGEGAYAYHQTSPTTSTSAQYFNSQAVHHGYAQQQQQQQQQYPGSPSSSMVYGTQQEYAQHRAYATSRDNHHQQHQQQQVSPPIPGYEAEWIAHAAGEPGQACWNGHVGHASSAEVNASGDSAVTHNPSSFSEIRVQGSVSPSQETDPSSYHARSTSGTVSSSSTHSSPAQLPNELYHHHHYHSPPSSTPVASRTTRPAMPSSSSVDNDLAQSLINLAHGPPASGPSVPRMNNASGAAVGHGPALTFKNALGSNNSPHSGHEVVY